MSTRSRRGPFGWPITESDTVPKEKKSTRSGRGPFGWPVTKLDPVLEAKKAAIADWRLPAGTTPMSKAQLRCQHNAYMFSLGMRERFRGGQRYTEPPVCGVCRCTKVVKQQGQGKPTTWRCQYCQKRQRKRYQMAHPELYAGVVAKYNRSEKGRDAKRRCKQRVLLELPPKARVKAPRKRRLSRLQLEQAAMSVAGRYLNQEEGPLPRRHNRRWKAAEEAKVVSEPNSVWGLAQILGRTKTAVMVRRFRLRRQQKKS